MKKNPFLSGSIYSSIKSKIASGEYSAGSEINANKLSEHFGTSRIPVRDSLNILCGEGLVQRGSNNRFIVAFLTEKDVRETYELRGILEGYLVHRAARSFGDDDIDLLEENIKQQEKNSGNVERFIQLNTEFHEYFLKTTTNSKFVNVLKGLRDYQNRYDRINMTTHGSFFLNILFKQHQQICEAVTSRNGELAEGIVKIHMDTGAEFLIQALKTRELLPEGTKLVNSVSENIVGDNSLK